MKSKQSIEAKIKNNIHSIDSPLWTISQQLIKSYQAIPDEEKHQNLRNEYKKKFMSLADLIHSSRNLYRYEQLLNIAYKCMPSDEQVLYKLLLFSIHQYDMDRVLAFKNKWIQLGPGNEKIHLISARIFFRQFNYTECIRMYTSMPDKHLTDFDWSILAKSYHKTRQYELSIKACNDKSYWQIKAKGTLRLKKECKKKNEYLKILIKHMQSKSQTRQSNLNYTPLKSHIFLVGFPRSGTTLLDQILYGHPDIFVAEEQKLLQPIINTIGETQLGIDILSKLSKKDLFNYQEQYWKSVKEYNGNLTEKIFVDKLPLNITNLHFIEKIFPKSKVIVAIRDPRDTILSCIMQPFNINRAMYNFLDISSATEYYCLVMNLYQLFKSKLSLTFHEVAYENIIHNKNDETEKLFTFVGAYQCNDITDHNVISKNRLIRTPSANQVRLPIYTSSIGGWKGYSQLLSASFDRLHAFIDYLGYE